MGLQLRFLDPEKGFSTLKITTMCKTMTKKEKQLKSEERKIALRERILAEQPTDRYLCRMREQSQAGKGFFKRPAKTDLIRAFALWSPFLTGNEKLDSLKSSNLNKDNIEESNPSASNTETNVRVNQEVVTSERNEVPSLTQTLGSASPIYANIQNPSYGELIRTAEPEQTLQKLNQTIPVFTSTLLIFTIDLPNSTPKVSPSKPLTPRNRWTTVRVELSAQSLWSDSRTPRPALRFAKYELSNRFSLPLSSPTRTDPFPPSGQRFRSVGRKLGSMDGSGPPFDVKLYSL
ncbi:BTB and TAZ domain protein 1 [Striga asiatica]|uniref:BTB and TAZ domain protein 1 n=1 Tax=Striga asiatica TaxID=4170 RepID=A0A5A7RDP7_STRAF|nr:BTB and TAZ domain protein 1 [Striga asiatica]